MKIEQFETIYDKVKHLLQTELKYRTSDDALVCRIWFDHLKFTKEIDPHKITAVDFLMLMRDGGLPSMDTITRARRKVQQEHPSLKSIESLIVTERERKKWVEKMKSDNPISENNVK
jgi:hypothetical protein